MEQSEIPYIISPHRGQCLAGKTVAVAGASGKIGRRLIPVLVGAGAAVVLFGRDSGTLERIFPGCPSFTNDELRAFARAQTVNAIIDLAVLNNAAKASLDDFRLVNVNRFRNLLDLAYDHNVPVIVGLSTIHALDPDNHSPYAVSKREMLDLALTEGRKGCRILVLPKVIMGSERGVGGFAWKLAAAVKPAVFFSQVAEGILDVLLCDSSGPSVHFVPSAGHKSFYAFASRVTDYMFAIGVLFAVGWLMAIVALIVRLDTPGPAIFRQRRVGQNERLFTLYKFRTMALGTREAGTHEINTSSVTRTGAILRRFKLDELPQAFNILRGDLSLVGPRPCLISQHRLINERRLHGIFDLRPGLTGLAQVHDIDMSDPARLVEWEVRYLRLRGLLLDIRIILQTFLGRGRGDRTSA